MTIADVLQDEQQQMMPCPRPFDGYVEQPIRVSSTSLIVTPRSEPLLPDLEISGSDFRVTASRSKAVIHRPC
jgi:hypothetical protein